MALIIILLVLWVWLGYEFYHAPLLDKDGNIIEKSKKDKP